VIQIKTTRNVWDEHNGNKVWFSFDEVIELLAYTRPRKVEAIRFSMVANKSFDNLSERMKSQYRARANAFIPNNQNKENAK